jgi:hypothetical protein
MGTAAHSHLFFPILDAEAWNTLINMKIFQLRLFGMMMNDVLASGHAGRRS